MRRKTKLNKPSAWLKRGGRGLRGLCRKFARLWPFLIFENATADSIS